MKTFRLFAVGAVADVGYANVGATDLGALAVGATDFGGACVEAADFGGAFWRRYFPPGGPPP